jgi:hypothetical protein
MQAKVNYKSRIKLWDTYHGLEIGFLMPGTVFEWVEKKDTWLRRPDKTWVNCGSLFQYATVISYDPPGPPNPPPTPVPTVGRFAIIKHLPDAMSDPTWKTEVNVCGMADTVIPVSKMKGSPVLFLPDKQMIARKMQTEAGYRWAARPGSGMIIRHYIGDVTGATADDGADPIPKIECVNGFGNFLKITETVKTRGGLFHRIEALPYNGDASKLESWFTKPWYWMKMTARTPSGQIFNVGDGIDSYLPLLRRTSYLWIHNDFVEIFPVLPPEGVGGYILLGASIFMQTIDGIKALRLARTPGELIHPYTGWAMQTRSVVPEVRSDFIYPI